VQQPDLSIIIPCFNESNRIGVMVNALKIFQQQWQGSFEVIVVDDGSTDDTYTRLTEAQKLISLQIIRQENTGKGGALKCGVLASQGEIILTLDADMATEPTELIDWLSGRKWKQNEIWIGSRELNRNQVEDKPHREFIGHMFNRIIRYLTGLKIHDTQCGFKLYHSFIAKKIFGDLQTPGWAHDVELLIRAEQLGYALIEMPVHWKAVEGSKIRVVRDSWKMFWEVVRISKMLN
jgi:dolichyl-phosphate beta-glucosyltransferase